MGLFKRVQNPPFPVRPAHHQVDLPILLAENISARYDGILALKDITFQLNSGERVAIVGPNGAGKSTLFKVIAGVLPPSQGQLSISGAEPGRHICIAYIPQRTQVDWNFPVTVADVVMMGRIAKLGPLRWPSNQDWALVHQALSDVGLEPLSKRQISELSGGQQQRMFIARALAQEAELFLMDEPLTGLDHTSQLAIFEVLDGLRQRNVTIMVATHDLDQAARLFDKVMLLNRTILGYGTPDQVFNTESLQQAYGSHLRLVQVENEVLAVTDTCCDEGHE